MRTCITLYGTHLANTSQQFRDNRPGHYNESKGLGPPDMSYLQWSISLISDRCVEKGKMAVLRGDGLHPYSLR